MKKLLCITFLLFSLFPSAACAASVMEPLPSFALFSTYSVDELLRSMDFILGELEDRGYSEVTLSAGEYTVGNDILPGKYTLSVGSKSAGGGGSIIVKNADGEGGYVGSVMYNPYSHVTHSLSKRELMTVELSAGQVLTIIGSDPLTFYTYDGI